MVIKMTIRHLKIFIAVAESGSMSATANKYYISQPTVSQTIRELEKHYGVALFDRLSKRLYITKDGEELLVYARQIVTSFNQMEAKMLKNSQIESLRVGGTMTVGTCLLSNALKDYAMMQPEIETYAYVGNTHQIEMKLLKSELDVGIIEGEPVSGDLLCEPLVSDSLVLVCNAEHRLATQQKIFVEDLTQQRFVMREEGSGTRELFERFLNLHQIEIDVRWEANCPEMIRQVVKDNDCLAVISERLVEQELKEGSMKAFQLETEEWNRTFKLVYHKDKVVTDAIYALKAVLQYYEKQDEGRKKNLGILHA